MSPDKAKKIAEKVRKLLETEPAIDEHFTGSIEIPLHLGGLSGAIKIMKIYRESYGKEVQG